MSIATLSSLSDNLRISFSSSTLLVKNYGFLIALILLFPLLYEPMFGGDTRFFYRSLREDIGGDYEIYSLLFFSLLKADSSYWNSSSIASGSII